MMKKYVALTVALLSLLALTLVGCDSAKDTEKQTSSSATEKVAVSESVESTEETAEKGTTETTGKAPDTQTPNGDGYTKRY